MAEKLAILRKKGGGGASSELFAPGYGINEGSALGLFDYSTQQTVSTKMGTDTPFMMLMNAKGFKKVRFINNYQGGFKIMLTGIKEGQTPQSIYTYTASTSYYQWERSINTDYLVVGFYSTSGTVSRNIDVQLLPS